MKPLITLYTYAGTALDRMFKYFRTVNNKHLYRTHKYEKRQRTTKPTIRRATNKDSDPPAHPTAWVIQIRVNENHGLTGWIYNLIRVFAGHDGYIVGFVMRLFQRKYTTCFILLAKHSE